MFKDWRGTPIGIGSRVLWATGSSNSVNITEGEVVEIKEILLPSKWEERFPFKLKVRAMAEASRFNDYPNLRSDNPFRTITKVERVTVIPGGDPNVL